MDIKISNGFKGQRACILPPSCLAQLEADPVAAPLHFTDIGFYPHAANHYRSRSEPIGEHVLIWCSDGAGWFEVNGKRREVAQGEFFVLPPGMPHSYGSSSGKPWTIHWAHFRGSNASRLFRELPFIGFVAAPQECGRIFEDVLRVVEHSFSDESLRYACAAFAHFLAMLLTDRFWVRSSEAKSVRHQDNIDKVVAYMEAHCDKPLPLHALAEYAGYSPSRFSAIFSQVTSQSPIAFFNQLKIRKACSMLDFTDLTVTQISMALGIDDPYYFSRLFKKTMGMSPLAYRARPKG